MKAFDFRRKNVDARRSILKSRFASIRVMYAC